MAPREAPFHDNPIELKTNKALRVIGALIAEWSVNPDSRPGGGKLEDDGRRIVFASDDFRSLLAGLPENDRLGEADYVLRDGITEIELILRRPGRLSFLLPEPEAVAFQRKAMQEGLWPGVRVPAFYWGLGMDGAAPPDATDWAGGHVTVSPEFDDAGQATYLIFARDDSADPLDAFIHPYMAAYSCAQCS